MSTSKRQELATCDAGQPRIERCAAMIAQLLETILGVDGVTADSNFFKIKGDSLAAITLAAAVEQELGVAVDAVDIFERPVIRDYAGLVVSYIEQDNLLQARG